jgi:hypothetical protein
LMRSARTRRSVKCAISNGDPGAIRTYELLPDRSQFAPSFGGWAADRKSRAISVNYRRSIPPANGPSAAEQAGDRHCSSAPGHRDRSGSRPCHVAAARVLRPRSLYGRASATGGSCQASLENSSSRTTKSQSVSSSSTRSFQNVTDTASTTLNVRCNASTKAELSA